MENRYTTTEIISGTLPPVFAPTNDLQYSVEIRGGHSLNSPSISNALNIGDSIVSGGGAKKNWNINFLIKSYIVRLKKPVSDSQLGRCWATDKKSSLELADERGCSMQPRGNIWGDFERVESNKEITFINRIKAWAFPTR